MWVMTPHGYVSAIAHRTQRDSLMVRARDFESLKYMCEQGDMDEARIYKDMPSDYPFRIVVKRTEFEDWMIGRCRDIGYTNFKSEATRIWGGADKYVKFLHRVWTESHSLVEEEVKRENDAAWAKLPRWGGYGKGYSTYTTTKYAPAKTTPPPALTTGASEPVDTGKPLPTLGDLVEMTEEDRAIALADLEDEAQRGDTEADDLLSELSRLLDDDSLPDDVLAEAVSVHSLTDAEFAELEARGQIL